MELLNEWMSSIQVIPCAIVLCETAGVKWIIPINYYRKYGIL